MSRADPTGWALLGSTLLIVGAATTESWFSPPGAVGAMGWSGRALMLIGFTLVVWARWCLGKSYAPTPDHPDPDLVLVRHGPYRWLRHPMYLGDAMVLVGLLCALERRWSFLALLPFFAAAAWRVRREERFLAQRFGSS